MVPAAFTEPTLCQHRKGWGTPFCLWDILPGHPPVPTGLAFQGRLLPPVNWRATFISPRWGEIQIATIAKGMSLLSRELLVTDVEG